MSEPTVETHQRFTNFKDLAVLAVEALRTGEELVVDPEIIVEAGDAATFLVIWKALRQRDRR